jgi:peptidyl-prolyl cis-trans isomerase B (cyclophilin B)
MLTRSLAALAALLLLTFTASCSKQDDGDDDASGDPTTELTTDATDEPTDGGTEPAGTCAYTPDGQEPAREVTPPPAEPEVSGNVTVVMKTSAGDLNVTLDGKNKPCTVGSFLSLAEQDYYNGAGCHRMADAPGFSFLQCGDPTGTGSGGPGYTIPDELTGTETYPAGTLAMANTGVPNSGGGQFFMISADSQFPPNYAVFGKLDASSIRLLQKAVAKGHDGAFEPQPGGGHPNEPVEVSEIVIR